MTGKILIYGGSGGIGAELARLLHAQGVPLHLVARNEARLRVLAEETQSTYTVGDVLQTETFARVRDEAGAELAGLVYAVGSINLKPLARLSEADFMQDFRVNALGAALAVQAVLPALKKHGGDASIVLFSSVAAVQGFAFHGSIGMAKGAVNGLVLSLAAELAPKVRVNAIAPSLTATPLAAPLLASEQSAANIAALHPLPRLGKAQDMAALAAFLLSEQASWITGQVISADGGRSTLRTKG